MSKYLPPIIWALFIFYLSSIPHLEVTSEPIGNFVSRKSAHLAVYAILAILIYRAFGWKKALLSFLISTLYGVSDEIHQGFVLERTFKFIDIILDSLGSLLGIHGINYFKTSRNKKGSPETRSQFKG